MAIKKGKTEAICIKITAKQIAYLSEQRIDRSKFMRQAIRAFRQNKFEYEHTDYALEDE